MGNASRNNSWFAAVAATLCVLSCPASARPQAVDGGTAQACDTLRDDLRDLERAAKQGWKEDPASRRGTPVPPKEPVAIPEYAWPFIRQARAFLKQCPTHENALDVKYSLAMTYYQHDRFEDAIPLFDQIVTEHPESEVAEYAANLLLDALNLLADYARMDKYIRAFMKNTVLMKHEGLRQILPKLQAQVVRKLAEKKTNRQQPRP